MPRTSADTGEHPAPVKRVKSTASVVSEYGYPHGHLGHLNEGEEHALGEFKAFLSEKGQYKSGLPPSHNDQTLLRFLRARRWVVQDAYKQFKDTEDWRAVNHLDVLYDTIDLQAYEQSRRLYPQWTGRRDKRGIPLYLFEIRHLDAKTIHNYEKTANDAYSRAHADGDTPPKLLRLFALYENLTRFVQPMCTEMMDRDNSGTPITLSTNIVDVSGVSLKQFWNLKSHMQAASQLATAHYPETLDRIFIIGAPFFFSTVWGWIKRWFDPITVSKIFILGHSEVLPTLKSFIDVKNIPKAYGGELDFGWGQMPNLDPAIRTAVSWAGEYKDFPEGPVYWRPADGDRLECIAVGSVNQVERMEKVCTIPRSYRGGLAAPPEVEPTDGHSAEETHRDGHVEGGDPRDCGQSSSEKPPVTTGGITKSVDSETPLKTEASDTTDLKINGVQGVQNLSIEDSSEKPSEKFIEESAPPQKVVA